MIGPDREEEARGRAGEWVSAEAPLTRDSEAGKAERDSADEVASEAGSDVVLEAVAGVSVEPPEVLAADG